MSLKATLQLLSERNVVPLDIEERNYLLRSFGFNCIRSFDWIDNLLNMMFKDGMLLYPWEIKVRYCDPVFKVALIDLNVNCIDFPIPMWVCVDSIIEAGKAPLYNDYFDEIQDMAMMCPEQEQAIISSMFLEPVKDGNESYWPELSFHIGYIFDVLFGVRGYDGPDGKIYVATNLQIAAKWRDAIVAEGKRKMRSVMKSGRYNNFVCELDTLEASETKPVREEKKIEDFETIKTLSARL